MILVKLPQDDIMFVMSAILYTFLHRLVLSHTSYEYRW